MASDSIIAKPINKVRNIERSDSGCRAMASSALPTALPMARAGPITPKAIPIIAATVRSKDNQGYIGHKLLLCIKLLGLNGAGQIDECKHTENIGLYQRLDDM